MVKKTITYTNPFTEQQVSEEHYFHISKADLVEMEMEEHDARYEKDGEELTGMQAKMQKIADSQDGKAILAEIKDLIRRSYGKKEGDRFSKSAAISEDFMSSEAFSQLLFELCTDAEAASEFINGIVPGNLEQIAAEVKERAEKAQAAAKSSQEVSDETPDPTGLTNPTTPRVLTVTEAGQMDSDELRAGLADGKYKLS